MLPIAPAAAFTSRSAAQSNYSGRASDSGTKMSRCGLSRSDYLPQRCIYWHRDVGLLRLFWNPKPDPILPRMRLQAVAKQRAYVGLSACRFTLFCSRNF